MANREIVDDAFMTDIRGLGIDIVEVRRIEQALDRWGDAFVTRLFTAAEDERARSAHARSARLAARFAAKEAVMKALGLGWRAMGWREIEIINRSEERRVGKECR